MAVKKTEETKSSIDEFKEKVVEVGMKLCDDVINGQARNNENTLAAITSLYNAVKG